MSAKVKFFKNQTIITFNLENWNADNNILLVTGLVGSGKTSFVKQLSKTNKILSISMDALKFYGQADKFSQILIDEFTNIYPQIKPLIAIHWSKTDSKNTNDKLYTEYSNLLFDFICKKYRSSHQLVAVEGIQVFVRLSVDKCINNPCCVIRTSSVTSFLRYLHRDFIKTRKFRFLYAIKTSFLYHIKQRYMLNRFLLELSNYQNLQSK